MIQAEERIIILAPRGRDAEMMQRTLSRAGNNCHVCSGLADLRSRLDAEVGAILVTEEKTKPEIALAQIRWACEGRTAARGGGWTPATGSILICARASRHGLELCRRLAPNRNLRRCRAAPKRSTRLRKDHPMQKDEKEPLAEFIKRKGGINECNARYGRCLRRLAARRRSIARFRVRGANKGRRQFARCPMSR
jgi:hypothetical protein